MTVSQFLVAMLGTLTTGQDSSGNILVYNVPAQKASIAFVCIYIFFFAATWGPIAWYGYLCSSSLVSSHLRWAFADGYLIYRVVTGEIFPLKVRAKCLSMTTAANWLLNWAIAYSTPYLVNYGPGNANLQAKVFFIWFGCCFICIAFVYFMIYETKGLTLEQIDVLYDEVKTARKSVGWKPIRTFMEIKGNIVGQEGAVPIHGAVHQTEVEKRENGTEYRVEREV
jgi:SP family sugar:H+ symporter-like MFS transporter